MNEAKELFKNYEDESSCESGVVGISSSPAATPQTAWSIASASGFGNSKGISSNLACEVTRSIVFRSII
jgi:hypothetical protein